MRAEERCPVTTYDSDVDGSADRRRPERPSDAGEFTVMDEMSSEITVPGEIAPDAGRAGAPAPWLRPVHTAAVGALTMLAALTYSAFSVMLHRHYGTFTFDLVIFDQVVRAYAHLELPASPVLQAVKYGGRDVSQLADHFSPIHAVLAPMYWIHNSPTNLLIAQGLLFAAAIPAIWLFARRAIGATAAYLTSIAFAVSWPLQTALGYDYHEVAFAVPLYAWMLERFQATRYRQAALVGLVLLLVKEDHGPVVLGFGPFIAV